MCYFKKLEKSQNKVAVAEEIGCVEKKKSSPGWMDRWVVVKAILRVAYSNKKIIVPSFYNIVLKNTF